MTEYESCAVTKTFTKKFMCPYCKEEHTESIYVKSGTRGTQVGVTCNPSRDFCREKKIFDEAGYVEDVEAHCYNCKKYSETVENCDSDWSEGDIIIGCNKYQNQHITPLGKCRFHDFITKDGLW